jgi:hypothetical protein
MRSLSLSLSLLLLGGIATQADAQQSAPLPSQQIAPQAQPKATPQPTPATNPNLRSYNYSPKVCGSVIHQTINANITAGNDPKTDLGLYKPKPIDGTTLTQIALGLFVETSDLKLSDQTRQHLVASLIGLYTDVANPKSVEFNRNLVQMFKTLKVKPSNCPNPDKSMAFIKTTFEQADIYRQWQHEYRMSELRRNLYPKEYKNRR